MEMEIIQHLEDDAAKRVERIFSYIMIINNRMQNAGEKLHDEISLKQWLLIAMAQTCKTEKTLTNIGNLMGCSRQNVKKLALALEKGGFARLKKGANNSTLIELTEKTKSYVDDIGPILAHSFELLFADFTEEELDLLFKLFVKLNNGIVRVEDYARDLLDHRAIKASLQ